MLTYLMSLLSKTGSVFVLEDEDVDFSDSEKVEIP